MRLFFHCLIASLIIIISSSIQAANKEPETIPFITHSLEFKGIHISETSGAKDLHDVELIQKGNAVASAKVLGIGTSARSGLEVTFNCDKKKQHCYFN